MYIHTVTYVRTQVCTCMYACCETGQIMIALTEIPLFLCRTY